MVSPITSVRFTGVDKTFTGQKPVRFQAAITDKLLRQPATDQVSFTGISPKDIFKIARKLKLDVITASGRHGTHIKGFSEKLGKNINVPIPTHGKDIGTGLANTIAKQIGFKNLHDMKSFLRG